MIPKMLIHDSKSPVQYSHKYDYCAKRGSLDSQVSAKISRKSSLKKPKKVNISHCLTLKETKR